MEPESESPDVARPSEMTEAANLQITTQGMTYQQQGPGTLKQIGRQVPMLIVVAPLLMSPILFTVALAHSLGAALIDTALCFVVFGVMWFIRRHQSSAES